MSHFDEQGYNDRSTLLFMQDTKARIAQNLDAQFAEMGFAIPGVDALRQGADVSLRTLYKYYPSREAMITGALEYRNEVYLSWISGGPPSGQAHILHIFHRLGEWLIKGANNGCLFLNALAAYPEVSSVRQMAEHHKECVRAEFARRLHHVAPTVDANALAETLLIIHEGQTDTAMTRDPNTATDAALRLARALLIAEGIPE